MIITINFQNNIKKPHLTISMFLKLYFGNKIHKISKIPETFGEFSQKVQEIFVHELNLPSCSIQYEDDEGDRIVLAGDDDYKTMLAIESPAPNRTIKIFLAQRKMSVETLPLKKSLSSRSNSDNLKTHQKLYIVSEDQSRDWSDKEEEKIAPPRKVFKDNNKCVKFADDVHTNKHDSPKRPYYCGITVKNSKSCAGEEFEIPSESMVVVTKFYQHSGMAQIVHKDHVGVLPLSDLKIMDKARFFHSSNGT
jgi:hypothetical protein